MSTTTYGGPMYRIEIGWNNADGSPGGRTSWASPKTADQVAELIAEHLHMIEVLSPGETMVVELELVPVVATMADDEPF